MVWSTIAKQTLVYGDMTVHLVSVTNFSSHILQGDVLH